MWVKICRIWRPTTKENIEIIEWNTHASPKQFKISTTKKMGFSGDPKSPLLVAKSPLLPNSSDKVAAIQWLLMVRRNCQIAATFFVAANSQSLAATFVAATIYFLSPEKMLKTTLESPLMT
jgi:hypothetical protein